MNQKTFQRTRLGVLALTVAGVAAVLFTDTPLNAQLMGGGGPAGMGGGIIGGMEGGGGMAGGGFGMQHPAGEEEEPLVVWSKPAGPEPDWLSRGKKALNAKEQTRRRLDEVVELSFNNIPLTAVLEELSTRAEVAFHADPRGLEQASVTIEQPITLMARASLKELLHRILHPIGLDYIVLVDGITITDQKTAEMRGAIAAYNLAHLVNDNRGGRKIVSLIQTMIAPESWIAAGGLCSCELIGTVLYVKASESMHEDIEQFLAHFARLDGKNDVPGQESLPVAPGILGLPGAEGALNPAILPGAAGSPSLPGADNTPNLLPLPGTSGSPGLPGSSQVPRY
ncbi:MAG: collagen-like protein [Pirellula sp.]